LGLFIAESTATQQIFGRLPQKEEVAPSGGSVEASIIERCREQGIESANLEISVDDVLREMDHRDADYRDFAAKLADELPSDPIDGLRALDDRLFLDLDRERAEREVRLAMSPPVVALGVLGAATSSNWLAVLAVVGAVVFYRNSLQRSGERARILSLMALKEILTPTMRRAIAAGRDDARAYARRAAKEAEERARWEEEQHKAEAKQEVPTVDGVSTGG
jgi:hypothetical protein